MDNNVGVYRIVIGTKFYIGSSVNLKGRERNHRKALKEGNHPNHTLRWAYKKHGEMTFTVIEYCDRANVRDREQYYLDKLFFSRGCANHSPYAVDPHRPTRKIAQAERKKARKKRRPPTEPGKGSLRREDAEEAQS